MMADLTGSKLNMLFLFYFSYFAGLLFTSTLLIFYANNAALGSPYEYYTPPKWVVFLCITFFLFFDNFVFVFSFP